MVYYFSGTGNSQLAAKQIAAALDDELVSINQVLKSCKQQIFHSERPLVFVAPTYAWRMPKAVSDWIRTCGFEGNRQAYFLLTCGGSVGNAAAYAKKLCTETKLEFKGLALVAMPNNYVALSNPPDKAECAAIVEKATECLASLSVIVKKGEPFPEASVSLKDRINSGPVCALFYSFFVHDKGFWASDKCISCGKCARRCPLNNIRLNAGKPEWHGNCTHCMACIGGCPAAAIEYQKTSVGNRRYYIMAESEKEVSS